MPEDKDQSVQDRDDLRSIRMFLAGNLAVVVAIGLVASVFWNDLGWGRFVLLFLWGVLLPDWSHFKLALYGRSALQLHEPKPESQWVRFFWLAFLWVALVLLACVCVWAVWSFSSTSDWGGVFFLLAASPLLGMLVYAVRQRMKSWKVGKQVG